jgi:hypothetical protein
LQYRLWGSLYAVLWQGRIDAEILRRKLLVCHPLPGSEKPVYDVEASVWPRSIAQCSPERGYYYHPFRRLRWQAGSDRMSLPVHR